MLVKAREVALYLILKEDGSKCTYLTIWFLKRSVHGTPGALSSVINKT